jgi:hypothetical protein
MGVAERPAVAAAAVAAVAAEWVLAGAAPLGATALAEVSDPAGLLAAVIERGVRVEEFVGQRSFA